MTAAAVVLGGAGGLGGAILTALTHDGQRTPWMTWHSDAAPADALIERSAGGRSVQCDVANSGSLERLAAAVAEQHDRVDVLVHAAVATIPGELTSIGVPALEAALRTSALSLLGAVGAFDRLLLPGASVIYLTSIGSERVVRGYGSVGVAKAAGEALVHYLAAELGPRGVRVNAVSAGPVATKALAAMNPDSERLLASSAKRAPLGRNVSREDVAATVASLSSGAWGAVTGQVVTVDSGLFLA